MGLEIAAAGWGVALAIWTWPLARLVQLFLPEVPASRDPRDPRDPA
jgi:hypothetical protein